MALAARYGIHANLPALEAVLDEVRATGVDQIVVGGDVLPAPLPRETLARLLAFDDPSNGHRTGASMTKARMETFSDGVIAILITIMVLGLEAPHGTDWASLRPVVPGLLTYLLSFVFLGIYWSNHHHMLQLTDRINGKILWANMHLLFWLSLVPVVTAWLGASHGASVPAAVYGFVLLMAALAYYTLQSVIIAHQGPASRLKAAIGPDKKGKISPVLYVAAIAFAFVNRWIAIALFVLVALMWVVPDPRIESHVTGRGHGDVQP